MAKNLPGSIPSRTLGVLGDIFGKTAKGVFTHDELALFAKRRNPFPDAIKHLSRRRNEKKISHPDFLLRLLDLWVEFWKIVGGRVLAAADLVPPLYRPGFDWPVVTPRDLTPQGLYDLTVSTKFFSCWKYWNDLDELKVVETYLRPIDEVPVVLIQPSVEPDTRLSYNQALASGLLFLSIRHRISLEPFGFWLNRDHRAEAQTFQIPEHLDPIGWTRTSSLDPGGLVAYAHWYAVDGKFGVNWSSRDDADPRGGVRLAVS
ncbi:MAG: hypothetical protein HYT47_00305 [Candidatus Vogelbacteria bacterium]|nr:hypothetical protein [Candidatus Vogelbacteria bacterium]